MSSKLTRPIGLCAALTIPALFVRLGGVHLAAVPGLLVFGAAVVAASFLLAWAAEASRVDISGKLAIAILAVIAVLPEFAVDLYFSYTAGHDPGYVRYAAANMTGSNRLLLGLGWPVVVIIALWVASRRSGRGVRELVLQSGYRAELGFLLIASLVALVIPASGQISLVLGFALLGFFVFYLWKASQAGTSEPDLAGPAARIGGLPARGRRLLVAGLLLFAAAVIVVSAEPFADSLIATGTQLGIDRFLLVQWLAPLASESPEFIVAIVFAVHGKGSDAIGTLISSKVNQWTLLVGSLPVAYLAGGGGTALTLDGRQVEEFMLTAGQTLLGVAALLTLRFPRWLAFTLLGLFAVQYALPGQASRYLLCAVYAVVAVVALARNRRHILPTLAAPFRGAPAPAAAGTQVAKAPAAAGTQVAAPAHPAGLPVPGRSLVLVAEPRGGTGHDRPGQHDAFRLFRAGVGERGHRPIGFPVGPDRGDPPVVVDGVDDHAVDRDRRAAVADPHRDRGDVGAARPVGEGIPDPELEPAHRAEVPVPEPPDSLVPVVPLALGIKQRGTDGVLHHRVRGEQGEPLVLPPGGDRGHGAPRGAARRMVADRGFPGDRAGHTRTVTCSSFASRRALRRDQHTGLGEHLIEIQHRLSRLRAAGREGAVTGSGRRRWRARPGWRSRSR
jgi:cation:H+ antiporter